MHAAARHGRKEHQSSKLGLGVQNIANKKPVLDDLDPTGRGFAFNLYDGYGRVPYLRYTQTF